jgi:hypothetical protein
MRPRALLSPVALAVAMLVLAPSALAWAGPGPGGFSSEQPAGTPYKHQSNWEPTVVTDPGHPDLVYQLITGINAHQCAPGCPGTSVLFRKSTDGGPPGALSSSSAAWPAGGWGGSTTRRSR